MIYQIYVLFSAKSHIVGWLSTIREGTMLRHLEAAEGH